MGTIDILASVRRAARLRILFLPHAIRQMLRPDRMIDRLDVRHTVEKGEVIEDYPEDSRGHSCLLLGFGEGRRPIHVVCAPKEDYLAIITAYLPDTAEWAADFKTRKRR
jgi:hypothetical protein